MQAKVKIIFYPGDGTVQTYGLNTANNVSNSARLGTSAGYKGFYLGGENTPGSSLDTKRFFGTEGYPGLNSSSVWNGSRWVDALTGADAEAPKLAIIVEGNDLKYMTIRFDELLNEYPPSMKFLRLLPAGDSGPVMETTVSLDGPVVIMQLDLTPGNYILTLQSWSKENSCAKITDLQIGHTAEIKAGNIFNLTASNQDRPQVQRLEYGLTSQYLDVELLSRSIEFAQLSDLGFLDKNLDCEVFFNDALIGQYVTDEFNVPGTEQSATIKCGDMLQDLHDAKHSGQTLGARSLDNMMRNLVQGIINFSYLDTVTQSVFENTQLQDSYLESGYVFEGLQKICAIAGCRMYVHNGVLAIKCTT